MAQVVVYHLRYDAGAAVTYLAVAVQFVVADGIYFVDVDVVHSR